MPAPNDERDPGVQRPQVLAGGRGDLAAWPLPEITVESDGVRLTKCTTMTAESVRLAYVLASTRDDPVRVRIAEPCFGDRAVVSTDGTGGESVDDSHGTNEDVTAGGVPDGGAVPSASRVESGRFVSIDRVVDPRGLLRVRERFPANEAPLPEFIPQMSVERVASTTTTASTDVDGSADATEPASADAEADATDSRTAASAGTVLVGVPAYNEVDTVADVVDDVKRHADLVLVVDDGSEDDTAGAARAAGASILRHETNRGYGASLQSIFRVAARADVDTLVVVDADGQHDAADVPALAATQHRTGADVVIGSRFVDDGSADIPRYRRFGVGVINLLVNVTTNGLRREAWLTDTQSGFRAYGRDAIESLAADTTIGDGMGASTDILQHVHRRGLDVVEVPTTISYDVENANSQSPVRHGLDIVRSILTQTVRDSPRLFAAVGGTVGSLVVALAVLAFAASGGPTVLETVAVVAVLVLAGTLAGVGVAIRRARATATRQSPLER